MTSYFDEHNCEPLGENQQPNHQLHLARLLIDTGAAAEMAEEFERLFDRKVPATSKEVISSLPTRCIEADDPKTGSKCPVCLGVYGPGQEVKELPCSHSFHTSCILPWLNKVNTCPLCRLELPTDDEEYEAIRKHKARQKEREFELEMLHNSMFG